MTEPNEWEATSAFMDTVADEGPFLFRVVIISPTAIDVQMDLDRVNPETDMPALGELLVDFGRTLIEQGPGNPPPVTEMRFS